MVHFKNTYAAAFQSVYLEAGTKILQYAGEGNALFEGFDDNEHMIGGAGNDTMKGENGSDTLVGQGGDNQLYGGSDGDALFAGSGSDTLDGGTGNDNLNGGVGNDVLIGDAGADTMTGGAGSDTFLYGAITESGTTAATRDTITDFVVGTDTINVSAIDADTNVAGNQAFAFIGTAAFSARGQARYVGGILEFNSTGNNAADMSIAFTGNPAITAANGIW
jgi:Ca2+-binding RTX toxin-like protein